MTSSPVIRLWPADLGAGYRLTTRLRLAEPPPRSTEWAVDLLFDIAEDAGTGYAVRFHVVTGVRYLALVRRTGGASETLADGVTAYSFGTWTDVEVVVDGARLEVRLDGVTVARGNDVRRVRHDRIGLALTGAEAEVDDVRVTLLHDDPLPAPPVDDDAVVVERPGLVRTTGPVVQNELYRLEVVTETWSAGQRLVTELSGRGPEGWRPLGPVDDWALLSGEHGRRTDLTGSLDRRRPVFDRVEVLGDRAIRLHGGAGGYDAVSVEWSLAGTHPLATVRFVPTTAGHHVVVHRAFGPAGFDGIDGVEEVLCGPLQHARMVRGPEFLGASELTVPLALTEVDGWTRGIVVPADALEFGDEQNRDPDDQPFGMALRREDGLVQPSAALPQYGRRALTEAGRERTVALRIYARPVALAGAYRELVRDEYGYRAYRENILGCSLTDTMFNLIDLLATGPRADDSEEYQASPSGWWSRAKGYLDIENDQAVRTTTAGVLLSAAYLTDDLRLYDERARPTIEFHLSRNGYGWTPDPGHDVYGDDQRHRLCATPFGVTALGPLHAMTRDRNPGIARLALADPGHDQDYWLRRAPVSAPLARYRLTGDPAELDASRQAADRYVAEQIDTAYTDPVDPHDFGIYYCRDWIGLLELYAESGERRHLDAAHTEACRFVTQVFVRPVHGGEVTVPDRPQYHDRQIDLTGWWDPDDLYDYPVTDLTPELVPRWLLSLSGMTFEAVQTYRYSGATFNPAWAAHLLRLASYTGDDLLADIAHNAVTGRYTNYPGYYFRQHTIAPLKPDFPYTGPFDNSTIYYHHAPAQLGMTIDYLLAEHETRSGGSISFPAAFEENFVWFRFRTYGHRPGVFYGTEDAWLWMPRDVVALDNSLVNWISARSETGFHLSLTNSSAEPQQVVVSFGARLGLGDGPRPVTVFEHGVAREDKLTAGVLQVEVPGHGLTAITVPGAGPFQAALGATGGPVAGDASYDFADDTPVGAVRGLLLARPDGEGYDAYVQSDCATPAMLEYSTDGGRTWSEQAKPVPPAEWTIRTAATIRYRVRSGAGRTDETELRGTP